MHPLQSSAAHDTYALHTDHPDQQQLRLVHGSTTPMNGSDSIQLSKHLPHTSDACWLNVSTTAKAYSFTYINIDDDDDDDRDDDRFQVECDDKS